MVIYEYDKLTVREVENQDVELLTKWLSNPEVLQYYEGRDCPHDEQMVLDKFFAEEQSLVRCIIEYETIPIGYIQFYPLSSEERDEYGYHDNRMIIYGNDQFIGDTNYWDQGIGTMLVRSMIEYLLGEKKVDKVVMDPQSWNRRAIACYEKCNFVKKKLLVEHEMHEGKKRDCWLMEYSR